jgi:hypothetical protein
MWGNHFLVNLIHQIENQPNNDSNLYATFKYIRSQKFIKKRAKELLPVDKNIWDIQREFLKNRKKCD